MSGILQKLQAAMIDTDLVPVISTGHVTQETANRLDEGDGHVNWTICAAYEHGWLLYVQPKDLYDELEMPADLRAVMDWGRELGVKWIRMDCDAGAVHGLPQYEW